MDACLKERELELRDEYDSKHKVHKSRYNSELTKAHDMIKERESEID